MWRGRHEPISSESGGKHTSRRALILSAVLILSLIVVSAALAAAGALDPSFSGDGKVVTDLAPGSDWASGVAMQADGKIVIAGGAASGNRFGIARYNPDGSLDATFSGDGKAFVDFTSKRDSASALAIQADGKIVVVGEAGAGAANPKFAAARLNPDGTLDATFSGDGKVTTDFTAKEDFANGVVIQADGKIVVDGPSGILVSNPKIALARYNPDGTLDTTFSGDGKVMTDFTSKMDWANGIALQADGKIVVVGVAGWFGSNPKFLVARYNTDGALDATFSGDGRVMTDFTSREDQAVGVVIQTDGRIVASGAAAQSRDSKFALARYNTDGSLDTTFSSDGRTTTDFTSRKDGAWSVALQADGKIVAAGEAGLGFANPTFALCRYTTDGDLDATFSGDGKVTTDFTAKEDLAFGVVIQTDGSIVAAGQSGYGTSSPKVALARYLDQ